ncbi:NAD-dependent epimerase/dehydratase family protein [uncultured Polaribacter sp.]|uniref:NAD-dependent epimerase/dehydratase family protein n=1 Tax=uncultured Polaribacter sp. TaxID=174711 RepID=UPI00260E93DE|nr:NAD-dependent epimerase/dehydratase family protein [uncultured Polaribacter sp.]
MKKTIITGNKGFVGLNLQEYLHKKDKVIIGVSRTPLVNELHYKNLSLDRLNQSKSFIHLAGKAHDLKNTSDDAVYFEVNTELTKTLFDQFLKSDCEVFMYMSSVKAAADQVEEILTEEIIPNPVTVYGKSKLAAENYILSKEIPEGKRVYILRPCMIHGPNNKGNLNLLYSFVSKGIPYPFGKYHNKRSFVSVENLCFIINELIENRNVKSGIYNVADNQPLSTNNLVSIIGKVMGKSAKIYKIPKTIVVFIAKIGDFLPLPVNSERLQKLTENYVVSNLKIRKAIGKELPYASKQGLIKTFQSFN